MEHGPIIDETGLSNGLWPRYLIMTSTDEEKIGNKLSPFAIHRGDVTIKRQYNGDIYLTCSKNHNRIIYSSVYWFGNIAVSVTPHMPLLHSVIKVLSSIVLHVVSLNCRRSSKDQECARSGHSNICLVFSDETLQSHVVSPS